MSTTVFVYELMHSITIHCKKEDRNSFSLLSGFKSFIYNSRLYKQSKRYFHDFISIAIKTKKVF